MKAILNKCDLIDLQFISDKLDTYFSPVDDKKRKELLKQFEAQPHNHQIKDELITLMDKQIRYFGSSDVAYLARSLMGNDGGISAQELIADVCQKAKVKIKAGASIEVSLERLVNAIAESELAKKSPEELANEFRKLKVGEHDIKTILAELNKPAVKSTVLPVIQNVLGMEVAAGISQSVIISVLTQIMGKQAANQLFRELSKRNPWINSLGPVVWAISATWLAYDVQGPAFRKTLPICLYLGIVALRDGNESDKLN